MGANDPIFVMALLLWTPIHHYPPSLRIQRTPSWHWQQLQDGSWTKTYVSGVEVFSCTPSY